MSTVELEIVDFAPYEVDKDKRSGFCVKALGVRATAECFDGYNIAKDILEQETLDFSFVRVEESAQRQGIGTALFRKALDEATNRGYAFVRMEAASPRTVRILDKLERQGIAQEVGYILSSVYEIDKGLRLPSQEVLSSENRMSSAEAQEYLSILHHDEDDMVDDPFEDRIDCVVRL